MNTTGKHLTRFLAGLAALLLVLNGYLFSYIALNGSGSGYTNPDGDSGVVTTLGINPIEMHVIIGGGYFLKANANIGDFLHKIEWRDLTGIDYDEIDRLIGGALANMTGARLTYGRLIQMAAATPYNPEVIFLLKNFDYEMFMEIHGLNPSVFAKVREYLETGDITGSFKHFHANLITIERMLVEIHGQISMNRMPELSLLWKLNETCAETSLYGSFVTRIFKTVNDNLK